MFFHDFKLYSKMQQWQIAKRDGDVFFKRKTPNHAIMIYRLDGNIFVEAWVNVNNEMLDCLEAYQSSNLLEKYTDQINLDDLY